MGIFNWITGNSKKEQIQDFLSRKAHVIDVRSPAEFNTGNATSSTNIPLNLISSKLSEIKELNLPIILVCQSGTRAGLAKRQLKSVNIDVLNGGSWKNI